MTGDRHRPGPGNGHAARVPAGLAPLEQDFDAGSLYALRSAVAAHAAMAGLTPRRVYDVLVAAHELAANAVRHGAGHGRLRLETAGGMLICQVSDDGPAAAGERQDPGAGAAPWPAEYGHGLWVIEQIADQFTIDRGPAGTTVTAAFALPPSQ
jgi:anti-sigma regulatory factor (Ser/Thr protein kinase)